MPLFQNESAVDDTAPAFLKDRATPLKHSRLIRSPNQAYSTTDGYYTGYPPYYQWQQATQWCWIAVAVSLANFKVHNELAYSQKNLAGELVNGQNVPGDPATSMSALGVFRGRVDGPISAEDLLTELYESRPVVAGMDYGDKHVVIISGASNGGTSNYDDDYYIVDDPWYGPEKHVFGTSPNGVWASWIATFFYAAT
jgi:hypothetical protein